LLFAGTDGAGGVLLLVAAGFDIDEAGADLEPFDPMVETCGTEEWNKNKKKKKTEIKDKVCGQLQNCFWLVSTRMS
jgi:hypothetical protein